MAQQDYLSKAGGQFGTLAGSILSNKKRRKKKDVITALAISAFVETLGAKNKQLDQALADQIEEVKDNYTDIFQNNQDIWNSNSDKRVALRKYEDEYSRDKYLNDEAINLFNNDKDLVAQYGSNPWSRVKKYGADALSTEEYQAAQELFGEYKELAEDNIKTFRDNPATSFKTFTDFNKLAKSEYKAALDAVKNDPTQKGAIRSWFNKRFGTDDDGKPRYGMLKKAELELIRENAVLERKAQDKITRGNSLYETPAEEDKKIDERIRAMREKYTGFTTNAELIASKRNGLKKKIESNEFTAVDLEEYLSVGGTATTNIPKIDQIFEYEIPNFVQVFTKVRAMREQLPDVTFDPTDVLTQRELNIYDLGMGINRDQGKDINEQIANESLRQQVLNTIMVNMDSDDDMRKMLQGLDGDFKEDATSGKDSSTENSARFITNVIRAATVLENKYDMDSNESLQQAYELQKEGLLSTDKKFSWLDAPDVYDGWIRDYRRSADTKMVSEYVDPDVYSLPLIPETAQEWADNVNESMWMQSRTYTDYEKNQEVSWNAELAAKENSTFVHKDPNNNRWIITLTPTEIKAPTNEEPGEYKWVGSYQWNIR